MRLIIGVGFYGSAAGCEETLPRFRVLLPSSHHRQNGTWSLLRRALAIPVEESFGANLDAGLDDGSVPISYSKCTMYAVNFTEVLANNIRKPDASWPTQPCRHGWEYNFTDVPYQTAATD
uniref:Uncharacterized protein n=1 Tax=Anopheles culicifacies TaxID=139723 RepID=A0A182M9Y7_9DIPT